MAAGLSVTEESTLSGKTLPQITVPPFRAIGRSLISLHSEFVDNSVFLYLLDSSV